MKKITFLLFALFVSTISVSQKKDKTYPQDINKKHEIKLNAFGLLAFEWLDISYEYLINEESSFGVSTLVGFDNDNDLDEYRKFSLTPFYRRYFSNKFARGFFIEGFGMLHTYEDNTYYYNNGTDWTHSSENKTEFAVGISVGGKFISRKGFTTEIYLGLGRNIGGDNSSLEAVGRGGISLGYRF